MVGGVLEAHRGKWDIGKEVINCISKYFPGVIPIRPKVSVFCILFWRYSFIFLVQPFPMVHFPSFDVGNHF